VIWRNVVIFVHNIVIYPLVLLVFWLPLRATAIFSVLGFVLLMINLSWMALLLGVLCTRYRDIPQIVSNLLQVCFYLTPIIWMLLAKLCDSGRNSTCKSLCLTGSAATA